MNCLGVNPKYFHLNLTNPPDKHSCLFLGLYEIFRWSHMCISLHVADSGWDFDIDWYQDLNEWMHTQNDHFLGIY